MILDSIEAARVWQHIVIVDDPLFGEPGKQFAAIITSTRDGHDVVEQMNIIHVDGLAAFDPRLSIALDTMLAIQFAAGGDMKIDGAAVRSLVAHWKRPRPLITSPDGPYFVGAAPISLQFSEDAVALEGDFFTTEDMLVDGRPTPVVDFYIKSATLMLSRGAFEQDYPGIAARYAQASALGGCDADFIPYVFGQVAWPFQASKVNLGREHDLRWLGITPDFS